jgi:pilus assembly protein CpaB
MQPRRLILALLLALSVSALFTWRLSRYVTRNRATPPQKRYVATARALESGEALALGDLTFVQWPASAPLEGAFVKPEDVIGRTVLYPLAAGEPILEKHLTAAGAGPGLTGEIPSGMRAVALKTDEVAGVAGFLLPGTHVDVLVTYSLPGRQDAVTATALQNVVVLAAGHQFQPDPSGKPASVGVVTLLLKPEEAEEAVLASTQGTIHFVLRNGADRAHTTHPPATLPQMSAVPSAQHQTAASRPVPLAQKPWIVETLSGRKSSSESFN